MGLRKSRPGIHPYHFLSERVLLDKDLADLYRVETRVLKQAVRRNIKRFPDDFMFELTKERSACKVFAVFEAIRQLMLLNEEKRRKIGFEVKEPRVKYRKDGN